MYIERKSGRLTGEARIGRITFSKTGKTLYYRGRAFQSLKGDGLKSNYYDVETGEDYWISGCGLRSRSMRTSAKSIGP